MASRGRGRLSAIDLLPDECDGVVSWAAQELSGRDRTQTEIYAEFREKLIAIQGETGASFDVPSFSSFNRYSVRLAAMMRRIEETRSIAATLTDRLDAGASDDLTVIAAEAIKTLIFEILQSAGDGGLTTKGAQELANALRAAAAAQSVSTSRRQKVEAEFADKVDEVVETVAREAGLSADRVAQLRRDFLGVRE
ncbi:DUF3486 family protein [Breoghania sp.]|uniref:DUF3486 family protein n=1 Tax=Breoghania sp. TaxID=2065378 RepID=UPI0029CA8DA5|nr:DUF3486 family protein [Breoghania sp.]